MPSHIPNVEDPFAGTYASREQRRAYAAGLRELAEWIETTEFPIPRHCFNPTYSAVVDIPSVWIDDEDFIKRPGSAARLIGGRVNKDIEPYGNRFRLSRDFGGGVMMRYLIERNAVCAPLEVEKEVQTVVPMDALRAAEIEAHAEDLSRELVAMTTHVVTVTRKVTEFDCPPALLSALDVKVKVGSETF